MRLWTIAAFVFSVVLVGLSHIGSVPIVNMSSPTASSGGLMLIMDTSASMLGDKIEKAKSAISSVASDAPTGVTVGLRTFATGTTLIAAPTKAGARAILHNVRSIRASGGTNIGGALEGAADDMAHEIVKGRTGAKWTWILVSDGEGNNPAADLLMARQIAKNYPNLVCHTIGIELQHKGRRELEEIARTFGGRSWVVGRDKLTATMQEAASLAGFSGTRRGVDRSPWTGRLAFVVFFLFCALAAALRRMVSESRYGLLLAVGAGALAWMANEFLLPGHGTNVTLIAIIQNAAYFMMAGAIFGVSLAASEGLYLGESKKAWEQAEMAFPVGVFGGALAGVIGQGLFLGLQWAGSMSHSMAYLPRMVGWAVAGAMIGACPGAAAKSKERVHNGAIGGVIGGAIGGSLFELLMSTKDGSGGPRLVALISLGLAVGLMVRVVEQMRKQAWLTLLSGGPEGKMFIVSKETTSLGSHYQCDVVVGGARGSSPRCEAMIRATPSGYLLETTKDGSALVNGSDVRKQLLNQGDVIGVAAGSLQFHLRDVSRNDPSYAQAQQRAHRQEVDDLPPLHAPGGAASKGAALHRVAPNGGVSAASHPSDEGIHFIVDEPNGRPVNQVKYDDDVKDDDDVVIEMGPLNVGGKPLDES